MILGVALLLYALGVLGSMSLYTAAIKMEPELMPGGGRAAVVVACLLWPVVIVVAIVGLIFYGASEL